MDIEKLALEGLFLITPKVFRDDRGFFLESYRQDRYRQAGIPGTFVQDNHSRSVRSTLRGLHFQSTPGQAKLVRVTVGRILDVVVDIRRDSPTLGRHIMVELDADAHRQIYVPVGFGHGFVVLSEVAEVQYKVSSPYCEETERGIAWDDPDLGIPWPVDGPLLSTRDQRNESFSAYLARAKR